MTHRTVLDDNLGGGGNSLPTLMGNIMHDLFQSTISCHALPTPDAMDAMAEAKRIIKELQEQQLLLTDAVITATEPAISISTTGSCAIIRTEL